MHWKFIGSFKDKSCLIGYVPELETEELVIELVFFNGFALYVKLELFGSNYSRSKSWFC